MNSTHNHRRWASWGIVVLIAVAWLMSLVALPWAPAEVPTHWNITNQPDRFAPAFPGLLFAPALITVLAVVLRVAPRIDPRREQYTSFSGTYAFIQFVIVLFLVAVHALMIVAAFGVIFEISRVMIPLLGVLFVCLGNVMGKVRPNWFVGFRTPWTLASSDVWTRTHRFGGRVMVASGFVMIVGGIVLPPTGGVVLFMVACVVMVLATFGYSLVVWRQLEPSHE